MRALASLLALAACGHSAAEAPDDDKPAAASVTCKPVIAGAIADTIEVTGVIAPPPKLDAVISSPIAGRVAQVAVEDGDHVAAGALLALIEDPALPASSVEAHAQVASAQAGKIAADQEVVRQDRLVASGIGARRDLDDARAKAAAAAAELEGAGARSGLASTQLARRELRAPHAGIVLHVYRRAGERVDGTAATPIAEIADLTVLEVHAQVAPASLGPLREGMSAAVQVLGVTAPLHGTIIRVAPAVDPVTLLGLLRIALDALPDPAAVKVGSAATATIVVAQRPGVRVPASALRRSLVGADEVVACAGGVAKVHAVTVGRRDESGVEIASGLAAGESVVIDHVLGLEDGQPLTAATSQGPALPDRAAPPDGGAKVQ